MKKYGFWIICALVLIAVGYWLGSPSPQNNNPGNAPLGNGTSATSTPTSTEPVPVSLQPKPQVYAPKTVFGGRFDGLGSHSARGTVAVIKTGETYSLWFGADFLVTNSSNLSVYFGRAGRLVPEANLGALKNASGSQSYAIPKTYDVRYYDEVWIWNTPLSLPVARAVLSGVK